MLADIRLVLIWTKCFFLFSVSLKCEACCSDNWFVICSNFPAVSCLGLATGVG